MQLSILLAGVYGLGCVHGLGLFWGSVDLKNGIPYKFLVRLALEWRTQEERAT